MMIKESTRIKIFIIMIALTTLSVFHSAYKNDKINSPIIKIKKQKSNSGVNYYVECIEDYNFLVTSSTHGHKQLAGPLEKCIKNY